MSLDRKTIIYVCTNDGSDMRINKEVASLSKSYDVVFLGIRREATKSFAAEYTSEFHLIHGISRNPATVLKLFLKLANLLRSNRGASVHVVQEQLYAIVAPLLIGRNVVLDIFDSYFLRVNAPRESKIIQKRLLYTGPNRLIVTDQNRHSLLPRFAQAKAAVIPNYPNLETYPTKKPLPGVLRIGYFGSLARERGSEYLLNLLELDDRITAICAGWISDEYTEQLIRHPRVEYLGVKPQKEANAVISERVDYLLMIYPCRDLNNTYASPNKIWDAVHTMTPVIINAEVRVSKYVEENKIGVVVNGAPHLDLIKNLLTGKTNFAFNNISPELHCWESIESELIALHN